MTLEWPWANGQNIYVYEKFLSPGGCLSLFQGYIHVYDRNIQHLISLKPLETLLKVAKLQ